MINVILAGKFAIDSPALPAGSFNIIARVSNFIDAKEKVQEYIPDYLIAELDLVNGTAWDLLYLIQKQSLPTRFVLIHNDLTYPTVRRAFRSGVWDYLPDWDPALLNLPAIPMIGRESDPRLGLQQLLGLIKDGQLRPSAAADAQISAALASYPAAYHMIYFRIDNIHQAYAKIIKNRRQFRNSLQNLIAQTLTMKHQLLFIKNHSGLFLVSDQDIDGLPEQLTALQKKLAETTSLTLSFTMSEVCTSLNGFAQKMIQLIDNHETCFFKQPGIFLKPSEIIAFRSLQQFNPVYQKERFQQIQEITLENLTDVKESAIRYFIKHHIYPHDIQEFFITLFTKIRYLGLQRGFRDFRDFSQLILTIQFCEYLEDLKVILDEAVRTIFRWIQENGNYQYSKIVRETLIFLQTHYTQSLTLTQLADFQNVSEAHLARTFQKEVGISVMAMLRKIRLEHAVYLLENTQEKIKTIAVQCGYTDSLYFSRIFHQATGLSPIQYRKQNRTDK